MLVGDNQLNMSGDGLKNYYTFAYSFKYNQWGLTNGLFYPYGDIGTYFDNQPLVVFLVSPLFESGLIDNDQIYSLIIWCSIASFILASILFFKIGREFGLRANTSLIFSLCSIAMSPQLYRVAAHYSLSYIVFYPLIILLSIKYYKNSSRYGVLIIMSILSVCASFVHPYIMLSICMYMCCFGLMNTVLNKEVDWKMIVASLVPAFIFKFIFFLLDPYDDRPLNPYGIWQYKTEVSDLFPFYGWFNEYFAELFQLNSAYSEGYCYPGILWILFILGLPFLIFVRIKGRRKILAFTKLETLIGFSSVVVLSFSMGVHMILTNKAINDWIPMLAQFRGLGRFSWFFYYVSTLLLFVKFDKIIRSIRVSYFKWLIIVPIVFLYANDIYNYVSSLKLEIEKYKSDNLLRDNRLLLDILEREKVDLSRIQAIIPLPIGTEGMEKLSFKDHFVNKINVLPFSFQTGIPITTCMQSRASISRTMALLQLSNSTYGDCSIKEMFDQDMDFLIVVPNEVAHIYGDISRRASLIFEHNDLSIYTISYEGLFDREVYTNAIDLQKNDSSKIYFNDFEDFEADGLLSNGAFKSSKDNLTFWNTQINIDTSTSYELSLWQFIEPKYSQISEYKIETFSKDQNKIKEYTFRDRDLDRVEVFKSWVRFKINLTISPEEKFMNMQVSNPDIIIDRVLLKEKSMHYRGITNDPCWEYVDHYLVSLCNN